MRSRTRFAVLLLPLALTACSSGDTDLVEPTMRIEGDFYGDTEAPPPPAIAQLTSDPATGALNPRDVEDAVRTHAAAGLTADGINGQVDSVRCLTGGPPLIYPATTLCHTEISAPDVASYTSSFGVILTDTPGQIIITDYWG